MITKFNTYIKENIENTKEVIFLVGYPASGKSTWLYKNKQYNNYTIINRDEIAEEVADENNLDYNELFNDNSDFIISLNEIVSKRLMGKFYGALENNENIIIDMINTSRRKRKGFLKIIKDYNDYKIKAVVFNVESLDLLKQVSKKRSSELNDKFIKPELYDEIKSKYVEPTKDEGFDEIIYIDNTKQLKKYLNDN